MPGVGNKEYKCYMITLCIVAGGSESLNCPKLKDFKSLYTLHKSML